MKSPMGGKKLVRPVFRSLAPGFQSFPSAKYIIPPARVLELLCCESNTGLACFGFSLSRRKHTSSQRLCAGSHSALGAVASRYPGIIKPLPKCENAFFAIIEWVPYCLLVLPAG